MKGGEVIIGPGERIVRGVGESMVMRWIAVFCLGRRYLKCLGTEKVRYGY